MNAYRVINRWHSYRQIRMINGNGKKSSFQFRI